MSAKKSKTEVEDRLHEICIEDIGEEYRVFFKSDDGGEHICVAFEGIVPPGTRKLIDTPFMGWRLIIVITPVGYLDAFHPLN